MRFISFNVLELRQSTKEGRNVSKEDRKRHSNCIEENVKYGKQYKPQGSEILKDDNAKIMKKTSKNIGKSQDVTQICMESSLTKPAVSSFGKLYLVGFFFCIKVFINASCLKKLKLAQN